MDASDSESDAAHTCDHESLFFRLRVGQYVGPGTIGGDRSRGESDTCGESDSEPAGGESDSSDSDSRAASIRRTTRSSDTVAPVVTGWWLSYGQKHPVTLSRNRSKLLFLKENLVLGYGVAGRAGNCHIASCLRTHGWGRRA